MKVTKKTLDLKKLNVLGVCAAQGCLLHPFLRHKKFKIVGNLEPRGIFHTPKEEQWKANFGNIPIFKDMFDQEIGLSGTKVDVIIGSPSCGHSSKLGRTGTKPGVVYRNPTEDKSLQLYLNRVKQLQPKVFLLENLPKMIELFTLDELSKMIGGNYILIPHAGSVSLWGNSQKSRVRMVLIGIRSDFQKIAPYFGEIFSVNTLKNCKMILREARKDINYYEPKNYVFALYDLDDPKKKNLTVQQVHDLWRTKHKEEYMWPTGIQKMKYIPGVYRNKKIAAPFTIRPANRQFSHTGWPIGMDEFRIIMGFPEDFKLYMENTDPKKYIYWINKGRTTYTKGAVYEMGVWFFKCLKKALKNHKSLLK